MGPRFSKPPGEALDGNHGYGKAVVPTDFVAKVEQIFLKFNIVPPPGFAMDLEDAIDENVAASEAEFVQETLVDMLRAPPVDAGPAIEELKLEIQDLQEIIDWKENQITLKVPVYRKLQRKRPPSKSLAIMKISMGTLKAQLHSLEASARDARRAYGIGHALANQILQAGPATLEAVAAKVNELAAQLAPVAGLAGVPEEPAEDEAGSKRLAQELDSTINSLAFVNSRLVFLVDHANNQAADREN